MRDAQRLGGSGFTLVEIIIVVTVIVLLAALTIPGLLRQRLNANEASAVASMRTIASAAITYRATNAIYPTNLSQLADSNPPYVDSFLGGGRKQGYNFTLSGSTNTFNATGQPLTQNITGIRSFFVDASGVIKASASGPANASSPEL